jgi:hypothetical protein
MVTAAATLTVLGVGLAPLRVSAHPTSQPLRVASHNGLPQILMPTVLHEPDAYELRGVSCVSTAHCVAVGYAHGPTLEGGVAVSITDGHLGKPIISTDPTSYYNAVSCVSATTCVVVGATEPPPRINPLAETWLLRDGTITQIPEPTNPANVSGQFNGVDCPTRTRCEVAGSVTHETPTLGQQPIAEFATVSLEGPASITGVDNNALTYSGGVSCPTASICVVGGSSIGESGEVARIAGSHVVGVDQPSVNGVEDVGCESATSCEGAEVQALSTFGQFQGWLEHLNGSLKGTPHEEIGTAQMYAVSPINSSYYFAVGYREPGAWVTALVSSSGAAKPEHSLNYGGYLQSVTCPVQTECVAVGFTTDPDMTQPGGDGGVDGAVAIIHLHTAPAAPRLRVMSTAATSIRVRVIPPGNTGAESITGYRLAIGRCVGGGLRCRPHALKTLSLSPHERTVTVSRLQPRTRYSIAALAKNAIGAGPESVAVYVHTN